MTTTAASSVWSVGWQSLSNMSVIGMSEPSSIAARRREMLMAMGSGIAIYPDVVGDAREGGVGLRWCKRTGWVRDYWGIWRV